MYQKPDSNLLIVVALLIVILIVMPVLLGTITQQTSKPVCEEVK